MIFDRFLCELPKTGGDIKPGDSLLAYRRPHGVDKR